MQITRFEGDRNKSKREREREVRERDEMKFPLSSIISDRIRPLPKNPVLLLIPPWGNFYSTVPI